MCNSRETKLSLHTTFLDISSELILFCKSGSDSDEDEIVARDLFLAVGVLCFTCGFLGSHIDQTPLNEIFIILI